MACGGAADQCVRAGRVAPTGAAGVTHSGLGAAHRSRVACMPRSACTASADVVCRGGIVRGVRSGGVSNLV
jgi:hypothetical protein